MKIIFNKHHKTSKNLIIYALGQCFNLITPLLVAPYIISVCGIMNYGKVGVALAYAFFIIVIIDFGIDIIGVKEVATHRNNKERAQYIFSISYSARFILLFLVCVILSLLFFIVPIFNTEQALFFLSLSILIGQYLNPTWFLQGKDNFVTISVLNIASKIIFLILVFVFVQKPNDYIYVNLFWGIGMILSYSYGIYYCIKKYNLKFIRYTKTENLTFLKNGYKFTISQLFLSFKNYSPILLISFLGGFNVAGFYRVIEQIISVFRTYLQVTFRFFYPKICFLISKNKNLGITFWRKVNLLNSAFVFFLILLLFIYTIPILQFFKINKQDIELVSTILRLALLLPFLFSISYALEQLLYNFKKSFYINCTIISVIINFIMMCFLFKYYNLKGIISSLLITEISIILAYSIFLYQYFKREKLN